MKVGSQNSRELASQKNHITQVATKMMETAFEQKRTRTEMTIKAEGQYFNKVPRRLKGRINAPLPIMSGFVDTLHSKIDDAPVIKIGHRELADIKKAQKATAAWKVDSSPDREDGQWAMKDLIQKKQSIFWGRGFFKYHAESDPEYRSVLDIPDPAYMAVLNKGGWNLENHQFVGETCINKSKFDLKSGERAKVYDQEQVSALIASTSRDDQQRISQEEEIRRQRLQNLGIVDLEAEDFDGQQLFGLAEAYLEWNGQRYYALFDPKTQIWVRVEPLKDLFSSDLFPYTSYATHTDQWNFWSKAAVDDVYPLAEIMRVIMMEALHNLRKRTSGHRAVDSSIFPDPSKLKWAPDKTVLAKAAAKGKRLSDGVYEFQTEDNTAITISLVDYFNAMLAQKTGVNAESQGQSEEKKVGIAFLNTQQSADRFNLFNKYYRHAWIGLAKRYVQGLQEHMDEGFLVEMIGTKGAEWEMLTRDDIKPEHDFSYDIQSTQSEAEADALSREQKSNGLSEAVKAFPQHFNPRLTAETILRNAGFEEHEIKGLMNIESGGDEILMSEAEEAIQEVLLDKKFTIPLNRGANLAFLQHIADFVADNEIPQKHIDRLEEYFKKHIPIAYRNHNEKLKNMQALATQRGDGGASPTVPVPADGPINPSDANPAATSKILNAGSVAGARAEAISPIS